MIVSKGEFMNIKDLERPLQRKGFTVLFAENRNKAREILLNEITDNASVGIGGSITIKELAVIQELERKGAVVYSHFDKNLSEIEREKIYKGQQASDYFLSSCNAITQDGHLIFIDGSGNRISAIIYGPTNVIIVVGKNKIVADAAEGIKRARNYCAPKLYAYKNSQAPCAKARTCVACKGSEKQCRIICILEGKPRARKDFKIILVDEELGI